MRLLSFLPAANRTVRFRQSGETPRSGSASNKKLWAHGAREVYRKNQGTGRHREAILLSPMHQTSL